MIRRPPRSTQSRSSAASDVYKRQLFIYHEESKNMDNELKIAFNKQYTLMEKRLANIITTPGMILALGMAICMVIMQPSWLSEKWLQIKISFVLGLVIYHSYCYKICLLYTSPSPRDRTRSRMPSSA